MRQASKLEIPYVVVVGPEELQAGRVTLRTMATGEEAKVSRREVVAHLRRLKGAG
jgi:histidyl-tRNA synthetase